MDLIFNANTVYVTVTTQRQLTNQHTGWPKSLAHSFVRLITSSNTDLLSNFFTVRIQRKFVIILSLKIPPHLKYVATLPCEMSMSYRQ